MILHAEKTAKPGYYCVRRKSIDPIKINVNRFDLKGQGQIHTDLHMSIKKNKYTFLSLI